MNGEALFHDGRIHMSLKAVNVSLEISTARKGKIVGISRVGCIHGFCDAR